MWWVLVPFFLVPVVGTSLDCGNLIAPDGFRYNLFPLAGVHTLSYKDSGVNKTLQFSICGSANTECGMCDAPGVCEISAEGKFCNGQFNLEDADPLLGGIGVQLHYHGGDFTSAYVERQTVITIVCDPRDGIHDIEFEGVAPIFTLRFRSSAGCPASGTGTVTFPYEYTWREYIYKGDPVTGHVTTLLSAGSGVLQRERKGKTTIDYDEHKMWNWGDYDKYHRLSCYYITLPASAAFPWRLPKGATFGGTSEIEVFDPATKTQRKVLTDGWKYFENNCPGMIWFEHEKAVPVMHTNGCTEERKVYYDVKLGQPDGSNFVLPKKCHPFQTCGFKWNSCKDPLCCSNNLCVPCE